MTLPMASCLVWRGQTRMPQRRERHGPSYAPVDLVVGAAEPVCLGLYPARLGALRAMGHRDGAVLGRADPDPDLDRSGAGVPLARPGTLCRVWGLGPRDWGPPDAARAPTG